MEITRWRQDISTGDLAFLLFESGIKLHALFFQLIGHLLKQIVGLVIVHANLEPFLGIQIIEICFGQLGAFLQTTRTLVGDFSNNVILDALEMAPSTMRS